MHSHAFVRRLLVLSSAALLPVLAGAQERGETIKGKITAVDASSVTVQRDDGSTVTERLAPTTAVTFADQGDQRQFPNPSIKDLKRGMAVEFAHSETAPTRITVNYVPADATGAGATSAAAAGATAASGAPIKARVVAVGADKLTLKADVAGRQETFRLADSKTAASVASGELVLLTVAGDGAARVVTRIDPAAITGVVTKVDPQGHSVSVDVNGQEQTYTVENTQLLRDVHEGDRVRFEVEERTATGARVVTALKRAQ
jgi:hypothetical protein